MPSLWFTSDPKERRLVLTDFVIELNAGPVCRRQSVVRVPVEKELLAQAPIFTLTCEESGQTIAAQADADEDELVFIVAAAPAEKKGRLVASPGVSCAGCGSCGRSRTVTIEKDDAVYVLIDESLFTEYHFPGEGVPKPYLAPIIGPFGDTVTRPISPEIKEHPHHRGLFIAHGDVCGEDIWNEPAGKHGRTDQNALRCSHGNVFAKLRAELTWKDRDGKPLMDETRSYWIYAMPREARVIDLKLEFRAAHGDVVLGPTKEAGFLGLRMHPDIDGNAGKGGMMENAYGGVGEGQCWSKPAQWCDYHGVVNGNRVGIAVFDNAQNLRFPTRWHIRDYGLFAANCWFWDGPHTIPQGETLTFGYRVIVHAGDTRAAASAERFLDYDIPVAAAVCKA